MDKAIVILNFIEEEKKVDIEIPLNISAYDLIKALGAIYDLDFNNENNGVSFLRMENPIGILKGNRTLADFKVRDGSVINIVK